MDTPCRRLLLRFFSKRMHVFLKQWVGVSSEALYSLVKLNRCWNKRYDLSDLRGIPWRGDSPGLPEIGYRIRRWCRICTCERMCHRRNFWGFDSNSRAILGTRIGIGHWPSWSIKALSNGGSRWAISYFYESYPNPVLSKLESNLVILDKLKIDIARLRAETSYFWGPLWLSTPACRHVVPPKQDSSQWH